jgi:hypothetical protein
MSITTYPVRGVITMRELVVSLLDVGSNRTLVLEQIDNTRQLSIVNLDKNIPIWVMDGPLYTKYVDFSNLKTVPELRGEVTVEQFVGSLLYAHPDDMLALTNKNGKLGVSAGEANATMFLRRYSYLLTK